MPTQDGDQGPGLARARRLGPALQQPDDRAVPGRGGRRAGGAGDLLGPVAKVAYPVALVLLAHRPGDAWCSTWATRCGSITCCGCSSPARPCRWGRGVSTIYSLPLTVAAALSLLPPNGRSTSSGFARLAVVLGLLPGLRLRRLQGGAAQHELATGLEGRPLAGRLSRPIRHSCWAAANCSPSPSSWDRTGRRPFSALPSGYCSC